MALDTPEELLALHDSASPLVMPGIPLPASPFGLTEKYHLLWLVFDEDGDADVPTPVPAPTIPIQRWLVRTAQFDQLGESTIEDFRISVKRGIGDNADDPKIYFRAKRDNTRFTRTIVRSLGLAGDRFSTVNIGPLGTAHVWQFEVWADDDCDVELQGMDAIFKRIGH